MKNLKKIVRNKYAFRFLLFIFWILLFDTNDLISQVSAKYKLHQLEKQKTYYRADIEEANEQIKELTSNKNSLEKFAREQYRMKRDNEEIFLILPEPEEE